MASVIESIMWITFFVGLGVVLVADLILAIIKPRKTFSRRTKLAGFDAPTIGYFLGLLPTHFFWNYCIVPTWLGAIVVFGVAGGLFWHGQVSEKPLHPILAVLIGALVGFLFTSS